MTDSLGDIHTEYFDPDETKKFNDTLAGDFEGIGAVVQSSPFGVIVEKVIDGSPANSSGVLAGDVIETANGLSLKNMSLQDAVAKIAGPAGTSVTVKILRKNEKDPLNKTITRKKLTVPSVASKFLTGSQIGYISLSIFGETTADDFAKALTSMKDQ